MRAIGRWYREVQTVVVLLGIALGLGFWLGYPVESVALVLGWRLSVYLWHLRRVLRWIDQPETEPPEGAGAWGMMLDQMYTIARHNRDARSRLQHTVDYLRDSFRSLRDGAILVDQNGLIEWSNTSAQRLLGLRYPQDKGQNVLSLVRYPEFSSYLLAGDYQEPCVVKSTGYPATHFQVEISSFGAGDRLILVRDITRFVQIEQTRQDFVGNVSHELRTPLTVITGYLETILDNADQLAPVYLKPLQQMSQQAQRMENLVRDLLWLSKIEARIGQAPDFENVRIPVLLAEVISEVRSAYPDANIELLCETSESVRGEYRELYSAVINLVVNAIKYSPKGAPVLVTWKRTDSNTLALSVIDSGLGIAEEHLPRLTERFYRIDESRSYSGGGTGLGLAIVKHVAAGHDARLHIESKLGQGSCFSLEFLAAPVTSESTLETVS